jgi:DNA-binding GntR family transcriptional regulator
MLFEFVSQYKCQIFMKQCKLECMQETSLATPNECVDKGSLHLRVADVLRDQITFGALTPGLRLNERVLCEELGVSRTPLREALKTLASEGLVELLPNRGARVMPMTLTDTAQTFEVLRALEGLAGELAGARASEDDVARLRDLHERMRACYQRGDRERYFELNQSIHAEILRLSGNAVLAALHDKLNLRMRRARYSANVSQPRWDRAMQEHDLILEALAAGNGKRLRSLLEEHLSNKCDVVIAALLASGTVSVMGVPTPSPTAPRGPAGARVTRARAAPSVAGKSAP